MAKKRRSKYSDFRNFDKTYRRYVRDYYRKARQIYKHEKAKSPDRERMTSYPTREELRSYMVDKKVLKRAKFAEVYRAVKRDLREEEKSSDPVQYIVNDQAYEYSQKQYIGINRAFRELELGEKFKFDFDKYDRIDIMRGKWKSKEFFDEVKTQYHEIKAELEKFYTGKELTKEIQAQIGELYFDSTPDKKGWR